MSNWTPDDLADVYRRYAWQASNPVLPEVTKPRKLRGTRRPMNKLEAAYSQILEVALRAGEISWYAFEPATLRIAPGLTYTPDFIVMRDSKVEGHECKGFARPQDIARLKAAAGKFPWRFLYVTRDRGKWNTEEVGV